MSARDFGINLTPREEQLADYFLDNSKSKRTGKILKRLGLRYKNYENIRDSLIQKLKNYTGKTNK